MCSLVSPGPLLLRRSFRLSLWKLSAGSGTKGKDTAFMAVLEWIKPGSMINGIIPDKSVEVVATQWVWGQYFDRSLSGRQCRHCGTDTVSR